MKKLLLTVLVLFVGTGVNLVSAFEEADVITQLQKSFPMIVIEKVSPSPVSPLVEVLTETGDLFYFEPKTAKVILGEILSSEGENLTRKRKEAIAAARVKALPLHEAIQIGNGKHVVIEFVDPDCPYCRRGEAFFESRTDITRHVFLYPIPELHPDAERKSRYILCADDQVAAYHEVMAGKLDKMTNPVFETCKDAKTLALLEKHKNIARQLGVRGTPAFWVNGHAVQGGLNIPEILNRLNKDS